MSARTDAKAGANDLRGRIEEANGRAIGAMMSAEPVLVDVRRFADVVPSLGPRTLTHAGPPVDWRSMSGAQRGAVVAAVLFEGWAKDADEAEAFAAGGSVTFVPNHDAGGVGPMAGVISPNMHVYVVEDRASGRRTYSCTEYDAFFGCWDERALDEVARWNEIYYPAIGRAVRERGGLDLRRMVAQALTMGDELHSRQVAASGLLAKALAPSIVRTSGSDDAAATLEELEANELTFLPLSMAACKAMSMAAEDVPLSTIVTAMSRNGTEFGIRVGGLGPAWFRAPAPPVEGVFFPGYGPEVAGRDIGDSAITETLGLGAFAIAAAPAITGLVGGNHDSLIRMSEDMSAITAGRNPQFAVPQLGFAGTPFGIDVRKVVQTGVTPVIDTATSHKDPGHRIIGAGISRAPEECFTQAMEEWFRRYLR